jgi:hypothetical protein
MKLYAKFSCPFIQERLFYDFLNGWKSGVFPGFPTGNGKIDILIKHAGKLYGLELKSFTNESAYREALRQTAAYGKRLGLSEISLVFLSSISMRKTGKKLKLNSPLKINKEK